MNDELARLQAENDELKALLNDCPFPHEIDNPKDGTGRILLTVKADEWFAWLERKDSALGRLDVIR